MATLILDKLWVNLLATGQAVSAYSARDREEAYTVPGETRTYAGGRRRSVTSAGQLGRYKFVLRQLTRTDVETLRGWCGQTVQIRDNKGRRFFAVYYGIDIAEWKDLSAFYDVSLSADAVTIDEAV